MNTYYFTEIIAMKTQERISTENQDHSVENTPYNDKQSASIRVTWARGKLDFCPVVKTHALADVLNTADQHFIKTTSCSIHNHHYHHLHHHISQRKPRAGQKSPHNPVASNKMYKERCNQ
ncbi:uncharacterized protein isoform X2 [Choristoneura fumiferana]|uniref:uncharacterized protein isoform X2 n=1 Tax=Choristoneura fumiferana TaxID=7141 RepID=UPI003D15DDE3